MASDNLNALIRHVTEVLTGSKLQPLDEGGGERHGAWEWTWVGPRADGRAGRAYVTVAALENDGSYDLEVWAGADDGLHFVRQLVREFSSVRVEPIGTMQTLNIAKSVKAAAEHAIALRDESLTGTYLTRMQRDSPSSR